MAPADPTPDGNSRIAVLESEQRQLREELREVRRDDLAEIKRDIRALSAAFSESREGLTRGERISIVVAGIAFLAAIVGAASFILQAAGS